jgi:probable rRNA maturation factor
MPKRPAPRPGSLALDISIAARQRARGRLALLRQSAQAAFAQLVTPLDASATIRLTNDAELSDLNARFRGKDEPTDVLSFASEQLTNGVAHDVVATPFHLGEIYISMDLCHSQARQHGHAVDDELRLLTVHGMLHLLGFDHMQLRRKRAMWSAQDRAFALLNRPNPLRIAKRAS